MVVSEPNDPLAREEGDKKVNTSFVRKGTVSRYISNKKRSELRQVSERRHRQQLLAATNAAYATLRADPEAWQEVVAERSAWDGTLGDGLEDR